MRLNVSEIRKKQFAAVNETAERIDVDLDKLDLFEQFDTSLIPGWTPEYTLKPWEDLNRYALDIETTGLESETCHVFAIGLYNPRDIRARMHGNCIHFILADESYKNVVKNDYCVRTYDTEAGLLAGFFNYLKRLEPGIMEFWNGWTFDIPFLETRANILGLEFPFWKASYETVDATAQFFGRPVTYTSYYLRDIALVDVMHKAMSFDFVARKLHQGYSLKTVPYELKLIEEARTELPNNELQQAYKDNNWALILAYLQDDLIATYICGEYLLPAYYFQRQMAPWISNQSIFTRGNGGKWNEIIASGYLPLDYTQSDKQIKVTLIDGLKRLEKVFKTDTRKKYIGGLTSAKAGLFDNVYKFDVASLYPSICINYGLFSHKDEKMVFLSRLLWATQERLSIKNNPNATLFEQNLQASLKVIINSGYGSLATGKILFNDFVMAALVTAYGRKILLYMNDFIESKGAIPIELDTDGIYFSYDGDARKLCDELNEIMPTGIMVENEPLIKGVPTCNIYIPPVRDVDYTLTNEIPGIRKNYIIVFDDKIKATGRFRKRDQFQILKEFNIDLVKVWFDTHEPKALFDLLSHYQEKIMSLQTNAESEPLLKITRKARANEVKVYDSRYGVVDSNKIASYYLTFEPVKSKRFAKESDSDDNYSTVYQSIKEKDKRYLSSNLGQHFGYSSDFTKPNSNLSQKVKNAYLFKIREIYDEFVEFLDHFISYEVSHE